MKKLLFILVALSFSVEAQIDYQYLKYCNKIIQDTDNSIGCLQKFYRDLKAFKNKPDFQFRQYESYNCILQPDPKFFAISKAETNPFYKALAAEFWKLYNDTYLKSGEIEVFIRLQDYKTDLEKGFKLIREMQQLQNRIAETRDKLAARIVADAKTLPPGTYNKPYQLFITALLHEEELLRKLSRNFNEDTYAGFAQEEILKSYLETDDLLPKLNPVNFKVPDNVTIKTLYESFLILQKSKQSALDNFNNTSTFDGKYANDFYEDFNQNFDNDLINYFAYLSVLGVTNGKPLSYYPMSVTRYDMDAQPKPWAVNHLAYSAPTLDSVTVTKQLAALPVAGFTELNLIVDYVNDCVGSMDALYSELRSEEYTWETLGKRKSSFKARALKFDKFKVSVSKVGLITKNSKNIPSPYRQTLLQRVDDMQHIMLVIQDRLIGLSQFISTGPFDEKSLEWVEAEVKDIEQLYTLLDQRKERMYVEVRKVYDSYPPAKQNSWIVASRVLQKAADESRKILRQVELRAYEKNESLISTTNLHEGRRDLIINKLKYLKGIKEGGGGDDPYSAYDYIAEYMNTIEEKIQALPVELKDKNKSYADILYMHNRVIDRYNQFTEIAFKDNYDGFRDPVRPMYILSDIYQPMKYHYDPPKPEVKKEEPVVVVQAPVEEPEVINFEGYPFNNMVLLLDVSSSMNTPGRLPQLKKSFRQLIKLMRKEDQVSIVVYSGKASVLLSPTSASDTTKIIQSIMDLKSDGKTNISDGLSLAYKTARKNFKSDGNNRIILATDGEFNTGESLYALAEKNSADIPLTVFDFSQKPDPIKSIQTLAERGKGNYVKVTPDNALKLLVDEARKN